jgi:23S rRNA (guanosine2251-2'-O)-methyltransferase
MKKNSNKNRNRLGRPQRSSQKNSSKKKTSHKHSGESQVKAKIPQGLRVVLGTHSCKEAIRVRPHAVELLWLRQGWQDTGALRNFHDWALDYGVQIKEVRDSDLEALAVSQQGAALFLSEGPEWKGPDSADEVSQIYLALDQVADPHNLGAVLRTSWLIGVRGVLGTELRSSGVTPAVSKVASGAAEHLPFKRVVNLAREIELFKEKGFWVYGLSAHAGSQELWNLKLPEKVVWVLGSEEKGLRKPIERVCDQLVHIPQTQEGASFNASVAAAITLGETQRQLRIGSRNP